MSTLWLAVANVSEDDRSRAVDALHDAGLEVGRAWVDHAPTSSAPETNPVLPPQRDPVGMTFFAGSGVLFCALAVWMFTLGGWWVAGALACFLVALIGATGVAACSQPRSRPPNRVSTS